ncbi:MAG: PrsW family intramembrane metalloprotease [Lachnospiraceae bacterium]|nr:PrsW family intramembrane metalloprotease [Lachnospiraceae bacterium]
MKKQDNYFSVDDEVALHPDLNREQTHAEDLPDPMEKEANAGACYYASTAFEPGVGNGDSLEYRELIRLEQKRYPASVVPFISILAGVAGGFFAVPVVFLDSISSLFGLGLALGALLSVVLGPFAEETLKQSGAIFQLEKMRGSIRYDWQFFLSGVLGGLVFSVLENLIYQYGYLRNLTPEKLASVMAFRWTICTALHILCTVISSMGLRRVWRESLAKERPFRLSEAFPWFAAAATVHGLYNLSMLLLDPFGTK